MLDSPIIQRTNTKNELDIVHIRRYTFILSSAYKNNFRNSDTDWLTSSHTDTE